MAAILMSEVAMPADKKLPVVNVAMDPAFLEQIDEYRFDRRFRSRVAAIKCLIGWALERNPQMTDEERERWS